MKKYIRYMIPNGVTISRILLTIVFVSLLEQNLTYAIGKSLFFSLAILFFIICLTDFLDGRIARYLKGTSRVGSYLDVIADFIFLFAATSVMIQFNKIPGWYLIAILGKGVDFFITSKIISGYKMKERTTFVFDYIGRITVLLFYVMPFAVLTINQYFKDKGILTVRILIYSTVLLAILSTLQRILQCVQAKKNSQNWNNISQELHN